MIRDTIEAWCASTIKDLAESYEKHNRRASGAWADSLESRITETKRGYNVSILAAYYSWWMERGRKSSVKFPPISAIRKWIDDKGITSDINKNSLAFLIARKIKREGYKGKPVIQDVLTDERVNELLQDVGKFFAVQLKSEILNGSN